MRGLSRRGALGAALTGATVIGLGLDQLSTPTQARADGGLIDEIYHGRHIRIVPSPGAGGPPGLMPVMGGTVFIDDLPLHVMSNADGTFTPITDHYQTYPSLRAAAHAAVTALAGANLVPMSEAMRGAR